MSVTLPENVSKSTKILLVDDVPSARKILSRMLRMLGLTELVEAGSVQEAIEKLTSDTQIDLVISDIHLKDGKGPEILDTLLSLGKNIPTIFVTSDMEKATFQLAVEKGASTYLLKPFSPIQLVMKIKEAYKVA